MSEFENSVEIRQVTPWLKAVVSYDENADNPRETGCACTFLALEDDRISGDESLKAKWCQVDAEKLKPPKYYGRYPEMLTLWADKLREEYPDLLDLRIVSLLDHGGYSLSFGAHRDWDSSCTGFMFSTPARMQERYDKTWVPNEEGLKKLNEVMDFELKEFNSFINGEYYRGDLYFWDPYPDTGWTRVDDVCGCQASDSNECMEGLVEEAKAVTETDVGKWIEDAAQERNRLREEDKLILKIAQRFSSLARLRTAGIHSVDGVVKSLTLLHRRKGIQLKLEELFAACDDEFFPDVNGICGNLLTGCYGAKCLREPFWPLFAKWPRPSPIVKG